MRNIITLILIFLSFDVSAQVNYVDTTLAVKIAKKAQKLIDSKKEKNVDKGWDMYKQAAEMGLMSAQRDLANYYIHQNPPQESEVIYWWTKLANEGDINSQYLLGYLYLGLDTTFIKNRVNDILGVKYMRMAAEQGLDDAEYFYGQCLLQGSGTIKNVAEGSRYMESAADKGNAAAQFTTGCIYFFGTNGTIDYNKAFSYTEKAAKQGFGDAQYNLGHMYHLAEGVEKNLDEAIYWYTKAMEQGVEVAQNNLALALEEKNGNSDESLFLLRKGADSGDRIAQYNLASRYELGNGVTQSAEMAFAWYQKSAFSGYAQSQRTIGIYYLNGTGVTKDNDKAFEWVLKAAEQDDTIAVNALGFFYEEGIGVTPNPEKAFFYYMKAAEMGYVYSNYNIAKCYLFGIGVEKSVSKAIEYATIAADNNIFEACTYLGYIYSDHEQGILKDNRKALAYFNKALNLLEGDNEKKSNIIFSMSLIYEELNDTKNRVNCLKEAANLGNPRAQYNLALCYYNGNGVQKDINKTKELLRKAASNKDDEEVSDFAQKALKQL